MNWLARTPRLLGGGLRGRPYTAEDYSGSPLMPSPKDSAAPSWCLRITVNSSSAEPTPGVDFLCCQNVLRVGAWRRWNALETRQTLPFTSDRQRPEGQRPAAGSGQVFECAHVETLNVVSVGPNG